MTKIGISIKIINPDSTLINDIFIDKSELTIYELDFSEGDYKIPLTTKTFLELIKIGKRDSLRIYKKIGKKEILIVSFKQTPGENDGITSITPLNIDELKEIKYPNYNILEKDPNCTISVSRFIDACTKMETVKPDHVNIATAHHGFIFTAKKSTDESGTIFKFGDTRKEFGVIKVNIKTIKLFKNINGLCPSGTIKFIAEPGLPLKLVCHIGCYGLLRIYIRNSETK